LEEKECAQEFGTFPNFRFQLPDQTIDNPFPVCSRFPRERPMRLFFLGQQRQKRPLESPKSYSLQESP
jgi:hypothetical protein